LSQETIVQVLSIEQEAVGIHDEAQHQAAQSIKEAEDGTSALREQILAQAHQEAEQILAKGQESAEAERARVITQAEAEARQMEETAGHHFDRAVEFVLDQVAGRK
jgi:vacuolar-type H+-ATPase subunit H